MLAITHLLAIVLIVRLLDLDRNEAFVALLFGVFIDLDHLLGIPSFVQQHGVASLTDTSTLMMSDVSWKSLIHEPIAFIIVAPSSVIFRFMLPLLAWGLHITMDYIQEAYLGISSVPELMLIGTLVSVLTYMEFRQFKCQKIGRSSTSFLEWERDRIQEVFSPFFPLKKWAQGLLQSRFDFLSE